MKNNIFPGIVVQLAPEVGNPMFAGCFMTVTEVKSWGVQGYVQALGAEGKMGGQAYYRAKWDEFEIIGFGEWLMDIEPGKGITEFKYFDGERGYSIRRPVSE